MSMASDILGDFADALLDPGGPVPGGIHAAAGPDIAKRFDVYRNNVFASLIDALQDSFPVIRKLLGDEFFRALAREFIIASPPGSPVLLEYGNGFAAFITDFEPLRKMRWLADIARLEMAWLKAYHAAEASPLDTGDLAAIAPEQFAALQFTMHPSTHLVTSKWPVLSIWLANQEGAETPEIEIDSGGEDILILRPYENVELYELHGGSEAFIAALLNGQTLEQANRSASQNADFDLNANLTMLIASGAFIQTS